MSSGGGRGGYSGSTQSEPWDVQEKYLRSIFGRAQSMATGYEAPKENEGVFQTEKTDPTKLFSESALKLGYFGDNPGVEGLGGQSQYWNPSDIIKAYSNQAVPTVARFTQPQELAQQRTIERANEGLGTSSTEGLSENALKNILTGYNRISPYYAGPASVNAPRDVNIPQIESLRNMIDPSIQSPNIARTNVDPTALDYQYRPELNRINEGTYLRGESNPYLEGMYNAATRNVINQFNRNIIPSIDHLAESAGRPDSGAWADLRTQANQDLLNTLGDVSSNIFGGAYESERGRMMQGLGLGGQLSEADLQAQLQRNLANAQLGQGANTRQAELSQDLLGQQLGLGLQRGIAQTGYQANIPLALSGQDLQRNLANAQFEQEASQAYAGRQQGADTQNIANILSGLGMSPTIAGLDYENIGRLAQTGEEQQNMYQALINALIKRDEFNRMEPYTRMGILADLIGGNYGGTVNSMTSAIG